MPSLDATATVAVVGAGTMGAGIAQVAALAGHRVLLTDAATGRAAQAIDDVRAQLARLAAKGRLDPGSADAAAQRLTPVHDIAALAPAALVIEAAAESLEVKRALFGALEGVVADDCLLATNTSSLSVSAIAAGLRLPGQVAGMHFFNPAPVMPLVEVVSGLDTAGEVAEQVAAAAAGWGKTPVHVGSTPGFIVNRVARPFYGEGLRGLEERAADPATIDAVLRESGGFRMGPLELTDLIGQDVNDAVNRSVWAGFGHDPRYAPSLAQRALVDAGRLGRKTGQGFYRYGPGAPRPEPATAAAAPSPAEVTVTGVGGRGSRCGSASRRLASECCATAGPARRSRTSAT